MISTENRRVPADEFDQIVRTALYESVCREQPPARVRSALLRAASTSRSQTARLAKSARRYPGGVLPAPWHAYGFAIPYLFNSRQKVDLIHSELFRLRFVL